MKRAYTRYISGPMRGYPNFNYDAFNALEKVLRRDFPEGDVLNPAGNFDGDQTLPFTTYLEKDLGQVIAADEVVLLPGWEKSEGAVMEAHLALWLEKSFALAQPYDAGDDYDLEFVSADLIGHRLDGAPSPRAELLHEAIRLITGDRNAAYGPPTQDFDRTAAMASAWGFRVGDQPLAGHHVAVFMILLKMSRLRWTPGKRDSWTDTAGYAGCGWECAETEGETA